MTSADYIILGGTGLVGSGIREYLEQSGKSVLSVHSKNYEESIGAKAKILINCNGNSFRYRANQDPVWDFSASVVSVEKSLFDFEFELYVYISTVDVYNIIADPSHNHEETPIDPSALMPYSFHKWLAERIVERYADRSIILRLGTVLGSRLKKNPVYDLLNGRPLFMSLESQLNFIDTQTISECIRVIVELGIERGIFNVAGTGSATLMGIALKVGIQPSLAANADKTVYRYHINNQKMSHWVQLPTSMEVVDRYLIL